MLNNIKWLTVCLSLLFLIASCQKDTHTNWNTGIVAPLASTSLTLANLVKDSSLKTNPDNSITLAYQSTVYELNLADQVIKIPDTSLGQRFTVDSFKLPQISFRYNASLGSMANNLIANGQGILGHLIINDNGHSDSFPPIANLPITPFTLNATNYFQTISLQRGFLEMYIYNHLPIPLQNLIFEVKNVNSGSVLIKDTIPYMAPYSNIYKVYNLAGKTVESSITLKVVSFSSTGTNGALVNIDTSDYIGVWADLGDLRASSAVAIFPAEDIISQDQELTQTIRDRKLTYIDCREGQLDVNITNAIQQPLRLTYQLRGAYDKSGRPLSAVSNITGASSSGFGQVTQTFDLSGYSINLTGSDGTKFNTYTQVVLAHIDSNGVQTQINNTDSIHIQYRLRNIKPNYLKGYAGRDTIAYVGSSPFSIANLLNGNQPNAIKFDKVSLSLALENGLGIDGEVTINSLTGVNANGSAVSLIDHSANPVIGRRLYVNKAQDFPLRPAITTFALSSATSNINDFISNLPNKINYDLTIRTNPNGNRGTYDDFAYLESRMKVNLDVNVPLSVIANNLTLRDSFNFSLGYSQKDVENIKDGTLHLLIDNKFPIQTNITLLVYDSTWHLLDTLTNAARVQAADINSSCRADQTKRSIINIAADAARIDRLRGAKHAVMTVVFNTKTSNSSCNGQYLKIFSDYNIDAKITGDFTYKVKL